MNPVILWTIVVLIDMIGINDAIKKNLRERRDRKISQDSTYLRKKYSDSTKFFKH